MLLPSVVVVLCVERFKASYIVLYYLACLVGRLSWSVATVIRDVPTVATVGTLRRPDWRPSGGGGDFSKRGERQTETHPVPIFTREVEKNVIFKRKTGENGENLRKRKRR